jgi:DNA-binding transcriptional LysR family regulator
MIDALSLDQLRVFVAIADHGSFSEAARSLHRVQSAISSTVANLENALGVALFDRSGWKPRLTAHGEALLTDARAVLSRADQLKSRARGLTQGLEAELSVVVDVMFPMSQLVDLVGRFREVFPGVLLRLRTEVLGGVPDLLMKGECNLGIQGSLPDIPASLEGIPLPAIALESVAAPSHPFAGVRAISEALLRTQTQIVLTDRSDRTQGRTFSVFAENRILTSDLGSKHAMLRGGLGWGFMPRHVVEDDIARGGLVELDLATPSLRNRTIKLFLVYRRNEPLGPAAQWMQRALTAHP